MLHLALCFGIWTLVSTVLLWRVIAIAKRGVKYLKRLHQIPCSNCAYFTGDYRLKCTVNPLVAMSETAIGCRDFMARTNFPENNSQKIVCHGCSSSKKPINTENKRKKPIF
ncbi:MAG: hypothetical protein ACFCU5_04325 [Pleurocapsa sp.]